MILHEQILHYIIYRGMELTSIQLMNTMKENGTLVKDQDGVECTIVIDQYMKESGTMIVAMIMAC